MLISFIVFALYQFREDTDAREITYDQFLNMVDSGEVKKVVIEDDKIVITAKTEAEMKNSKKKGASESDVVEGSVADNNDSSSKDSSDDSTGLFSNVTRKQYYTGIVKDDTLSDRLYKAGVEYEQKIPDSTSYMVMNLLVNIVPLVIMIGLGVMLMRRMTKGGGMMGVGKSNAKMYVEKSTGVTFKDVAGQDEAKESLQEVVDFLHNPGKYTGIGAKLPKGALLVGPPGTGKTLLAKAVAGEAKVPFFSLSGSAFVEMYVGVGASRVRDLFKQAQQMAPCIIFIDEIDAIGKSRDSQLGGNDEREQTLNQLLAEMDGFDSNKGLLLLAATNRPEILDPALLRPGRFDRQITVNYPDIKGREEILKVHARNKKFEDDVDFSVIAKTTSGFTGADLANLLNEAALLAVRRGKSLIGMDDIEDAFTKVVAGPQKKSMRIKDSEKRKTAYHEAGHAVLSYYLPTVDPVHTITIVPSGNALGYTLNIPAEDKYSVYKQELKEKISMLLGGRAAEMLTFGDYSGGASNDIKRATEIAHKMVTQLGMSEELGPIRYGSSHGDDIFLGRDFSSTQDYSDATAAKIDSEIRNIIESSFDVAKKLLTEHADKLKFVAEYLVTHETMDGDQFLAAMEHEATVEELEEIAAGKKRRSAAANKAQAEADEKAEAERKKKQAETEAAGNNGEDENENEGGADGSSGSV